MFCPNCGSNVNDSAFCPNCGTKIPVLGQNRAAQETVQKAEQVAQETAQEATQAVEEAVPAVEETAQAVEEAVPAVEETAQAVEEAVPAVEETTQAVQEAVPAVEETVQAVEEAAQTVLEVEEPVGFTGNHAAQTAQAQPLTNEASAQETAASAEKKTQTVTKASDILPPQNFTDIQPVKKKKKWPKVLGITAVIAAVLAAAVFLAWPLLEGIISPRSKAVAALKNASSSFEEAMNKALDGEYAGKVENSKITLDLEIKKASFGGVDYLAALPAKYMNIVAETSVSDQTMAGSLGLGTNASASDVVLNYYMDSSRIYMSIPALFGKSFYMKNDSFSEADISSVLGNSSFNAQDMQKYAPVLKAVVKDVMDGVDEFIEDLEYKTVGKDTYASDNGDIDVTVYDITIKEKMVKNMLKTMLTNILDDKELSSYTSLLGMMGMNKETLLKEIDKANMRMPDVTFTMYVNKRKEVVKLIMDMKQFGEDGDLSVEFIGKDDIMDYIVFQTTVEGTQMRFSLEKNGNRSSVKLDMLPDQTGETKGEFISVGMSGFGDNGSYVYDSIYARGRVSGEEFEFELSGKCTTGPLATLSKSASDFKGAINMENMTLSQQRTLMNDLKKNADVLKKVLPASLVNELLTDSSQY